MKCIKKRLLENNSEFTDEKKINKAVEENILKVMVT